MFEKKIDFCYSFNTMEIKYLGHSSFLIKTKTAKIVTDPFDSKMVGLKFPKVEADIVTISHQHQDHNQSQLVLSVDNEEKLVIDLPGEFEKKGVRITGYLTYHDQEKGKQRGENIIYKIEAEGISVLHCGDLGEMPNDHLIDLFDVIDVLMVPVGGFYTIDSNQAVNLVKKIEPSIVIPMHYNHSKLNQEVFGKISPVEEFFKKGGWTIPSPLNKLVIKKEEMEEEMKAVLLGIS